MTPADEEWDLVFVKERRKVIRLVCRLNRVRYSQVVAKKYLNEPSVVAEALRRMRQKSQL